MDCATTALWFRLAKIRDMNTGLLTVRHSDRWVYNAYTMTFFSEYVSFNLPESNMNDYKKILRALFEKIDFFYFWLKIMGCCKTDFE